MSLENYLKNPIPFGEACAFLVEFHKLGSEMDGVVAPAPDALGLYAAVAQAEFKSIFAYTVYAQTLHDLSRTSLAEEFQHHADEELAHVEWVLRRLAVLGGPPPLQDVPMPPPASDPLEVVQNLIQIEQESIAAWQALHGVLGDDPARFKVEEFLAVEQEHLDDMMRLLPAPPPPPMAAPGEAPPPPAAPLPGDGGASVKVDLKPGGEKMAGVLQRAANKARTSGANLVGDLTGSNVKRLQDVRSDFHSAGMFRTPHLDKKIGQAKTRTELTRAGAVATGVVGANLGAQAAKTLSKEKKSKHAAAEGQFKRAAEELMGASGEPPQASSQLQADPRTSAFLQNEMEGQTAQEQNEAEFYKQRFADAQQQLEAATQASEQAGAQAQQLQQQAEQNQMALSSAQNQAQQATALAMQQVMQVGDEKLQQQMQAAQMRMAFQDLRGQLLNLASQEPPSQVMTDPATPTQPGQPAGPPAAPGQPPAEAPPPEAAAPPEAQEPPAPGGEPAPAPPAGKGTSVTVKQGSFRDHALGAGLGALVGGAGTALEAGHGDEMRDGLKKKISVLEQEQGSFPQAMRLVANKALLGASETASKHPVGATIMGSLAGAAIGGATQPAVRSLMESGRRLLG